MSTFTLSANSHVAFSYAVPQNGRIRFDVESERPTATLVVDSKGLAEFKAGRYKEMHSYGGSAGLTHHVQELHLPFRGPWYLLIVNWDPKQVTAVHYNVWS